MFQSPGSVRLINLASSLHPEVRKTLMEWHRGNLKAEATVGTVTDLFNKGLIASPTPEYPSAEIKITNLGRDIATILILANRLADPRTFRR